MFEPAATRTPDGAVAPGMTISRLLPSPAIDFCTFSRTPMPIETMAMTAPTPMMMPSIVRMDRILLARRPSRAMIMLSQNIGSPPFARR